MKDGVVFAFFSKVFFFRIGRPWFGDLPVDHDYEKSI